MSQIVEVSTAIIPITPKLEPLATCKKLCSGTSNKVLEPLFPLRCDSCPDDLQRHRVREEIGSPCFCVLYVESPAFAPTLPVFSRGPNDCLPNSLPDAFVCPTRCHDFLVKSAQSLASRGLAPDALSAHLLTPQVGAFNCFARPCAQCFCLPNLHFNPRPAAVPKHSRAGGGAKHLPAGGGAKPPPLLPRGRRRCQAPPGPAEVPNTSRLAAVPTPSPSPAAGSGAKHPPAGGGAKHPPAGGGAKHPPAGGGAKCVNFFEPREVDVPVSTRHSFCAVSLRRTSHRP